MNQVVEKDFIFASCVIHREKIKSLSTLHIYLIL